MALAFGDAGGLAAAAAQVIELGAAHLAAADHLDGVEHRRIERKHAFNAFAVGNLADREVLVHAVTGTPNAHAFVGLDTGAVAFDHLDVDLQGIARLEIRYFLAGGKLRHLLFFELFDQIHWISPSAAPVNAGRTSAYVSGCAGFYAKPSALSPFRHGLSLGLFDRRRWGSHKSGRRSRVIRSASARRQAATLAWSPESSTSGIGRPSNTCGRVNCGYSKSPSEKLSSATDACAPTTPGNSRTQASSSTSAATSPPDST